MGFQTTKSKYKSKHIYLHPTLLKYHCHDPVTYYCQHNPPFLNFPYIPPSSQPLPSQHSHSLSPTLTQSCTVCLKKFANIHRLQRHMISHQESDVLRRFKCDECGKAFKFKHHLKVSYYVSFISLLFYHY